MNIFKTIWVFLTLAGSPFPALAEGPPGADPVQEVDKLFAAYSRQDSPGAAVLVVKDGKVLINKGYGMANFEHRIPVTPETVFDVASISKQFTGYAVALLCEQGIISPEDDIRAYIPELQDFGHVITIGHLVHHTSGFRNWTHALSLAGVRGDDQISFERILNMAYRQRELNFVPGSEYSYSNTGYNLLAELVQRVTGLSFREWTEKNIFHPLGMKDTRFRTEPTELIFNGADSYQRREDGRWRSIPNHLTAYGSSSLLTTSSDLAKWVLNLDDPQAGGPGVRERIFRADTLNNGEPNAYAYGLLTGEYRGTKRIYHNGAWASFRAHLSFLPEHRFSVVVLNNFPLRSVEYAERIIDIYLSDELEPAGSWDGDTGKAPGPGRKTGPAGKDKSSAGFEMEEYTGVYLSVELEAIYSVMTGKEGLCLSSIHHGIIPLDHDRDDRFAGPGFVRNVEFYRDRRGKVQGFKVSSATNRNQRFCRIEDTECE